MRAEAIEGWMDLPELEWLAEQAKTHREIVEVGSYLGRSTMALAEHTPGNVWAIDNWFGPTDGCEVPERETIYKRFCSNLKEMIDSGKVSAISADHTAVQPEMVPSPDMVFIDGDHSYESVKRDIEKWKPVVTHLLCGHDLDYRFPGVEQALKESVPDYKQGPGRIWYWHKC